MSTVKIHSSVLDVLMMGLDEDVWAAELCRNGFQYGASIIVFSPVWDAVTSYGNYPLGAWTDTVFLPEEMAGYLPEIGKKEAAGAAAGRVSRATINANFHAGTRLSILGWSDFAVVSRPDPTKPDDIYVALLWLDPATGEYDVYDNWTNNVKSSWTKVIHVDDLTQDEIDMLGFDPSAIPTDEGWVNRLESAKIKPGKVPVTCFVLVGRDKGQPYPFDTWQGQTGKGRPLTRSVINDRFWKPSVPVWAWEFNKPNQRDTWLTAPPDGVNVPWKDDDGYQWRQQHGLSQVVEGDDRDPPEFQQTVLLDDGTQVEVYVFPLTKTGRSPLDNAAYDIIRKGGYVIDFQGENYHALKGSSSLTPWGIWNKNIGIRTMLRVLPPEWSTSNPIGVTTDIGRAILTWQQGPSRTPIEQKIAQWQRELRRKIQHGGELEDLAILMAPNTPTDVSSVDITKDIQDLATEFGTLYTEKVTVEKDVPDPDARIKGHRPTAARQRRLSTICPECYRKLPFPGHADDCSLKPVPRPPKPVEPGKYSWDGEVEETGTVVQVPDPNATKKEKVEEDRPAVSFPEIVPVDWSDVGSDWFAIAWAPDEIGSHGEKGVIRVAWGLDATTPDRYPSLVQAHTRLCETWGLATDNHGARQVVSEALWRAVVKVLSGKFGHIRGQAKYFKIDGGLAGPTIDTDPDHPALLHGLTVALYGIQDLERFAKPILQQSLGAALGEVGS